MMKFLLFATLVAASASTMASAQSLTGAVCVAKSKVPGCNACDPPVTPTTTTSKSKQVYTCTACGSTINNAYDPLYDPATKRCPCAVNNAQNIDVSALLAAAQNPTYTKEQRKAFAKQAGLFKLKFVGGLGGVCMACPATADLLGQTYTATGGLASVCVPTVAPVPPVTP